MPKSPAVPVLALTKGRTFLAQPFAAARQFSSRSALAALSVAARRNVIVLYCLRFFVVPFVHISYSSVVLESVSPVRHRDGANLVWFQSARFIS